uniref:GAT domain-containing protein n=1 Tax=Leptocylindrus danicus TaxID=163516 RepID=A0A7S2NRI1_9STRA|mmetsp:Transcript_10531/g.15810  ORF Transcript_10531/g.15810 Transcript_10531/m.15810 type:complete len:252 (+) Transcript_10531:39-794(+)
MMDAIPNTPVANNQQHQVSPDEKILKDLDTLTERINLGNEMIQQNGFRVDLSPGGRDETMLQVLGFLKACQPRMVELVEAAAQGALQEGTLMRCLEVNDLLAKVLDFENAEKHAKEAATASSGLDGVASAAPSGYTDLDDLLFDDIPTKKVGVASDSFKQPTKQPAAGLKSDDPFSGEPTLLAPADAKALKCTDNDFDDLLFDQKKPTAAVSSADFDLFDDKKPAASTASAADDDFDVFLRERASGAPKSD